MNWRLFDDSSRLSRRSRALLTVVKVDFHAWLGAGDARGAIQQASFLALVKKMGTRFSSYRCIKASQIAPKTSKVLGETGWR